MPDPKKKPIIVNSKNDPRYKAYQDSLKLFKIGEKDKKQLERFKDVKTFPFDKKDNLKETDLLAYYRFKETGIKPTKEYVSKGFKDNKDSLFAYGYDKPRQVVEIKSKIVDIPQVKALPKIQPQGISLSNQEIISKLPIFTPQAPTPKSFDIEYSAQRMNDGTGYYEKNNVQGVDIETALRAQAQADRYNKSIQKKYGNSQNPNAIERLKTLKDTVTITPQYAYGGQLNNNMQNNNLTRFNEGGLHHQNPLGGIPVGNGNTVEQGETKMKNYVYSNRLSIDENMTKEMNLPSYIKGKTFASASKAIDNKFKDRNDKHSLETKKVFLERLKEAQETLKQQEQQKSEQIAQSMQSNQQEVPDMMNGQIPEGMEEYNQQPQQEQPRQFFNGGNLNLGEVANMTGGFSGMAGKASPYLGAASGALSLGSLAQGNGASTDKFSSALSGATTGAQAGMAFGPLGAGIGAAVGIGAGLLGANKANKAHLKDLNNQALAQNRQFQDNNFAKGGYLTSKPSQYAGGGYITSGDPLIIPNEGISPTYNQFEDTFPNGIYTKPNSNNWYKNNPTLFEQKAQPPFAPDTTITPANKVRGKSFLSKTGDYLDKNGGKFLKYAPVAMNAYQLAKLKKPENQHLQRLSDKYKAQYVDEAQLQNIANQEMTNTINGISQSGASQGAIRSSILGAGLNKTKALSDAYMKANAENRATDDKGQTFNLGVNQFNAQTQHQESENWERNAAAYRNEKSKLLSAIGTDLGSIGKEEVNKNQIAEALGYDVDGDYVVNKVTKERIHKDELAKRITAKENTTTNAYGGYLKMNKIGRR